MLISGYITAFIDRPGWLIVVTEENSGDRLTTPAGDKAM
jgi:hypothetical protein